VVVCGRTAPSDDVDFVACDVRDPDAVNAMVTDIVSRLGRLDVVVNNAGGSPYADAATASPRLLQGVVTLNLLAPFYVAQAANAVMQTQDTGGVIVNIGSVAARRPAPGTAAYNAAKAGLSVLTRSLALEWAPKVRVNQVSPGLMGSPADVAAACLMLCSPDAGFITGADLYVDGGGEFPAFLSQGDADG
jgi:NAD(P)-dependent dehydrogenase (short-subunit alcohol dehydrogenase family)